MVAHKATVTLCATRLKVAPPTCHMRGIEYLIAVARALGRPLEDNSVTSLQYPNGHNSRVLIHLGMTGFGEATA